jgi:hypothetical protein
MSKQFGLSSKKLEDFRKYGRLSPSASKCLLLKLYFVTIDHRADVGIAVAKNVSNNSALL